MSVRVIDPDVEFPVPFGDRYWLVDQIAEGGMAEIYLGRQNAMAGFEKEIVIKRLKPALADDAHIVEMFLDEARIGALLNHPNIVHVYDVGEQDGVPYIAMEYIRGEELNDLCRRGLGLGRFLPLEHAVDLIRQAAAGMGYFHAMRGGDGAELEIVHCDISPTNLLVTEDGFLKIIDFGIARAANQRLHDAGAVPGKLSYMAPEQARREPLDRRADIFSLGIVLYEITVGRRLFRGPAQEVYARLSRGDVKPPTFVRRDFPGALESVIMRALDPHPAERYESAYDLADDLEEFLREARLRSGPVRIARYLDELAEAAGGERRPELIAEAERTAGDDALDFDHRGLFDQLAPAESAPSSAALEWDDYEESARDIADVLGVDIGMLKTSGSRRTPAPSADRAPAAAAAPLSAAAADAAARAPTIAADAAVPAPAIAAADSAARAPTIAADADAAAAAAAAAADDAAADDDDDDARERAEQALDAAPPRSPPRSAAAAAVMPAPVAGGERPPPVLASGRPLPGWVILGAGVVAVVVVIAWLWLS